MNSIPQCVNPFFFFFCKNYNNIFFYNIKYLRAGFGGICLDFCASKLVFKADCFTYLFVSPNVSVVGAEYQPNILAPYKYYLIQSHT